MRSGRSGLMEVLGNPVWAGMRCRETRKCFNGVITVLMEVTTRPSINLTGLLR
jgi:hypothetical protein